MKIAVIGAGAMGGSFGGLLARAGHDVTLIDTWQEHVEAINRDGLTVGGALGEFSVEVPALTAAPQDGWADWAIAFTNIHGTADAARTAARILTADGAVVSMQNGIGNIEQLIETVGA